MSSFAQCLRTAIHAVSNVTSQAAFLFLSSARCLDLAYGGQRLLADVFAVQSAYQAGNREMLAVFATMIILEITAGCENLGIMLGTRRRKK